MIWRGTYAFITVVAKCQIDLQGIAESSYFTEKKTLIGHYHFLHLPYQSQSQLHQATQHTEPKNL